MLFLELLLLFWSLLGPGHRILHANTVCLLYSLRLMYRRGGKGRETALWIHPLQYTEGFFCGVLHAAYCLQCAQAALQHRWNFSYVPSSILGLSLQMLMAASPSLDLYTNLWLWFYTRKQETVSCMCSVVSSVASMRKARLEKKSTLANNKSKTYSNLELNHLWKFPPSPELEAGLCSKA